MFFVTFVFFFKSKFTLVHASSRGLGLDSFCDIVINLCAGTGGATSLVLWISLYACQLCAGPGGRIPPVGPTTSSYTQELPQVQIVSVGLTNMLGPLSEAIMRAGDEPSIMYILSPRY